MWGFRVPVLQKCNIWNIISRNVTIIFPPHIFFVKIAAAHNPASYFQSVGTQSAIKVVSLRGEPDYSSNLRPVRRAEQMHSSNVLGFWTSWILLLPCSHPASLRKDEGRFPLPVFAAGSPSDLELTLLKGTIIWLLHCGTIHFQYSWRLSTC